MFKYKSIEEGKELLPEETRITYFALMYEALIEYNPKGEWSSEKREMALSMANAIYKEIEALKEAM